MVTAKYHRIPHDWTSSLHSSYSSQYTGGGDFALIDGIRGTANWSGGRWQGYWGKDFVAVLDLGAVQTVSKVGAGFLQDMGSWIWMPRRVEIELSIDGRKFGPAFSIANEVPEKRGRGGDEGFRQDDLATKSALHKASRGELRQDPRMASG